jgi:hypothetical protein
MRSLLAVALLGVLVGSTPAFAESVACDAPETRTRTVEVYHSAGEELGMSFAATFLSVLYAPVRLAYGIVGAGVGGAHGFLTGGNERVARGVWRVSVDGDYYMRSDHLNGSERFDVINTDPVVHDRYVTTDAVKPCGNVPAPEVAPAAVETYEQQYQSERRGG